MKGSWKFLTGIIVGGIVTRVLLNQYVQDRKVFMRKEKYLLGQLKKEKAKTRNKTNQENGGNSGF